MRPHNRRIGHRRNSRHFAAVAMTRTRGIVDREMAMNSRFWLTWRLLVCSAAMPLAFLQVDLALAQSVKEPARFKIFASGGVYPIINGSTDLPDGTRLLIILKKPWLPDGQQRLARGLPACGDDCFPADGAGQRGGIVAIIKGGSFVAGPFSFNGKPFRRENYPLEIFVMIDVNKATNDEIRSAGTPIYVTKLQVTSD